MAKSTTLPNGNTDPSPSSSTSVFNALGSYADRIREKELKEGSLAKKDKSPNTATSDLPNGSSSHPTHSASSTSGPIGKGKSNTMQLPPPASTSSGKTKAKPGNQSQNGKAEEKEKVVEEEGAWETVPAGRTRRKERDSTVSTNWRERPKERKEAGWRDEDKSKNGERVKKGTSAASTPHAPSSSSTSAAIPRTANTSSSAQATSSSARSASVTPASSTRNPWGIVTPAPAASGSSSLAKPRTGTSTPQAPGTTAQTPKSAPRPATTPSSPSMNATSTSTDISAATSTASPNMSSTADTASVATVVTPRNGEENDWRVRSRKLSTETVDQDTTLVEEPAEKVDEVKEVKKTAAPPVINAWAERRKAMNQPSMAKPSSTQAGSSQHIAATSNPTPILFGSVEIDNSRPLVNGDSASSGEANKSANSLPASSASKKKRTLQVSGETRHVVDTNAFPDLASAQQVTAVKKGEKERSKEKESEESSVVDESGVATRKTKWTAIPASELLAAADEAAETQRRIAREQAARRAKPPMALAPDHSQSPLKQARKKSVEARRGRTMRAGSGSELRLPPNPFPRPIANGDTGTGSTTGTVSATAQEFKPVFGNFGTVAGAGAGAGVGAKEQAAEGLEGKMGHSEPMSRQTSGSAISSPQQRSQTQLSSPTKLAQMPDIQIPLDMAAMKLGMPSEPKSAVEMGSNTAPIPQSGFPAPGGPAVRGRGQRQSFSGRGRGGFRGGAGGGGFKASNSAGDVAYLNNYGQGRGGYGMAPNGYDQGYGVWDPMQGYGVFAVPQMGGRNAQGQGQAGQQGQGQGQGQVQGLPMPPPPMPVTMAVGLDALRFYVLGQVEYYFSMQNLAMDFFLRQQMDSEGWIDISMISSFNRIRSLTPDPAIIKEVMLLSSLLEVREDKVRLSHGESKRWVLPDAKPSPFTDESTDEVHSTAGGIGENGDEATITGGTAGMDMGLVGWGSIPMTNGTTDNGGREGLAQDVKDALMKRGPSAPASTITGTSTTTGTETGTRTNTENGDMEDDEGKSKGEIEVTPGTSLSGEEAEKVELR